MSINCPICGTPMVARTYEESDGYCRYTNYICVCKGCNLFKAVGAADNYYGREYFHDKESFMANVAERIKEAQKMRFENGC